MHGGAFFGARGGEMVVRFCRRSYENFFFNKIRGCVKKMTMDEE